MNYPGLIGTSYRSTSPIADQEHTVNKYYEPMESAGASTRQALYPMPGVSLISTAASSPGRANWFGNGRQFTVQGTNFNEVSVSGLITLRGTVATDSNPATISSNGDGGGQLFITSGGNGYCFDLTTAVLTQIVSLNGQADRGDFLDGYFLALDATTSTMRISDLLDGLTWDPTQFAQRSAAADPWRSMLVLGQYIWLLGELTSEVWYDAGSSPFPFAKHPSGLIPYGIKASFSVAVGEGSIVWLDATRIGERVVRSATGFSPQSVSDYPLNLAFSEYAVVSDAQADTINWLGHVFYLLTFPTENITWVLDLQTGRWVQWGTWIWESNAYVAWRPRHHAMAFGEHRMLDSQTGAIYMLSKDVSTDVDERPIRWLRRPPALSSENLLVLYPGFELDMETGLGTSTGQGFDPQVMLRISRDGGKTWGPEKDRSSGKIGAYSTRVRWDRIGSARRLVLELSGSDPVPTRLIDGYLTPDPIGLPQRTA